MAMNEPVPIPDKLDQFHQLIVDQLSLDEFCELMARVLCIDANSGKVNVQMSFRDGTYEYAQITSPRIGKDRLRRMGGFGS